MIRPLYKKEVVKQEVLFFDVCASTSIPEDIIRTESQETTYYHDSHFSLRDYFYVLTKWALFALTIKRMLNA